MRWWRRRDPVAPPEAREPESDPAGEELLGGWARSALTVRDALSTSPGRLAVSLLGESVATGRTSSWFGHEPDAAALADLLVALGEPSAAARPAAEELAAAEQGFRDRRPVVVPDPLARTWRDLLAGDLDSARAQSLPQRAEPHREAERVWRAAAAAVSPRRSTQLTPDLALTQLRWFPGCRTRTGHGYSDPLNLGHTTRSAQEHLSSGPELEALDPAWAVSSRGVDPLDWRLSCLAYAVHREDAP